MTQLLRKFYSILKKKSCSFQETGCKLYLFCNLWPQTGNCWTGWCAWEVCYAASTSVGECRIRQEMLMWTCSRSAANSIHSCDKHSMNSQTLYLFGIDTSKKNTFAMLSVRLTTRTLNKPLFSICSDLPQSRIPRSHTDVDIPLDRTVSAQMRHANTYRCFARCMAMYACQLASQIPHPLPEIATMGLCRVKGGEKMWNASQFCVILAQGPR